LSVPHRSRGVKILKAISSPLRLQILNLLFDRGALSYTELMSFLKMNPSSEAGRFAYHLKFLLKTDLIEADVESKKYCLTDLGKMVINVADRVEKTAFKRKKMLVRTSRFALEEFDANKIAMSLVRETKMPSELAQKVAKEAEKQLLKSKTKYLTAPLVREVVNAILIEKGLEEYRHKLTRLGLPVYEVTALIDSKSKASPGLSSVHEAAGESVLKEYMLLNVFPRDISDAHVSGALHINGLDSWILKPSEIFHDTRFFFKNGINLEKISAFQPPLLQPQSFEAALCLIFNFLLYSAREISETQSIEYFNVFLAPFVKDVDLVKAKEALRLFFASISHHLNVSLGLELTTPEFIADKPVFGSFGKCLGKYGDFRDESQSLASLVFETIFEESRQKPLFNPKFVVKVRPETFTDEKAKLMLLKALNSASEKGMFYFANVLEKDEKYSVQSASGLRLSADLNGDWEIDTLRVGCLGRVSVNLPRIVYEVEGNEEKFLEIFKNRFEMATRALEIKDKALRHRSKGLLPFLMQSANVDNYLRLENCSNIINLVGLKEAIEVLCGNVFDGERKLTFVEKIVNEIQAYVGKIVKKRGRRFYTAVMPDFEASKRLVNLDIERYGVGKVRYSGTKEKPFYSNFSSLTVQDGNISLESLSFERKMHALGVGGNLTVIELGEVEQSPEELLSVTRQVFEGYGVKFLTYRRTLTYCVACKKSWFGLLHKCPLCGSTGTLTVFDRFAL